MTKYYARVQELREVELHFDSSEMGDDDPEEYAFHVAVSDELPLAKPEVYVDVWDIDDGVE